MARVALGPSPGSHVVYVPESFRNRSDPDPIVVTLLAPSEKERREIDIDSENPVFRDKSAEPSAERETAWQERMLNRFVVRIDKYTRGAVPIDTADKLIQHGERALYFEVYTAVMGLLYLTDESAKFYAESLDSTPQATRLSGGTAATADFVASTSSAIAELVDEPTLNSSMSQPTG